MMVPYVQYGDCIALHVRCNCPHPEFAWLGFKRLLSAFLFEGRGGYEVVENKRSGRVLCIQDKATKTERCVCGRMLQFQWQANGVEIAWVTQ